MAALPRPRLVFTGAVVATKLDLELLEGVARARPEWAIALVGPVGAGRPAHGHLGAASACPTSTCSGARPYAALPEVLRGADVALVPYAINELTRSVFPMKVFEYLAAGLPVVTTPLPALARDPGVVGRRRRPGHRRGRGARAGRGRPGGPAGALRGGARTTPGTPAWRRSTPIFPALAVRDRISRLARRMGYEVRQYTPLRSLAAAREELLGRGVDVVLDVGANAGQYGAMLRELGLRAGGSSRSSRWPRPTPSCERRAAADGAWEAVCVAASDVDGEITLNVTDDSRSSSVLPRNERFAGQGRLGAEGEPAAWPRGGSTAWSGELLRPQERAYLKLDIQGYERTRARRRRRRARPLRGRSSWS